MSKYLLRFILFLLFIASNLLGYAQSSDSTLQVTDSVKSISAYVSKVQLLDTLPSLNKEKQAKAKKFRDKSDSLNLKLDSLKEVPHGKLDAVATKINEKSDKVSTKIDSVGNIPEQQVEKAKSWAKEKLYSNKAEAKLKGKVSSIREKADIEAMTNDKLSSADTKLGELSNGKLSTNTLPENGLHDKLERALPKTNRLTDLDAPEVGEIEGLESLGRVKKNIKLGEIKTPDTNVGKTMGNIKNLPNKALEGTNAMEGMGKVKGGVGKVNEATGKVKGATEELSNIPEAVENRAGQLEELKGFKEQTGELSGLQEKPEELKKEMSKYQDKDFVKQRIKEKAMELGTDHFAQHQDKIKQAQQKLAKLKRKYPEGLQSTEKLPKVTRNSMKGKSIKERMVFGGTFRVFREQSAAVDISPQIGFRISGRWSAGLGHIYRLRIDEDKRALHTDQKVYGGMIYSNLVILKGFFVRLEAESVYTEVPTLALIKDAQRKEWVNSILIGAGKRYTFFKGVKGNMQAMYNLMYSDKSPYQNKILLKFGFEFGLKKKSKS